MIFTTCLKPFKNFRQIFNPVVSGAGHDFYMERSAPWLGPDRASLIMIIRES